MSSAGMRNIVQIANSDTSNKCSTRINKTSDENETSLKKSILPKKTVKDADSSKNKQHDTGENLFTFELLKSGKRKDQNVTLNSVKKTLPSDKVDTINDSTEQTRNPVTNCAFSREALSQFFERNKSNAASPKQKTEKLVLSNLSNMSGCGSKLIDLSVPVTRNDRRTAKLNALKYIKKNGPIKKINPNGTRGINGAARKRSIDQLNNSSEGELEATPKKEGNSVLSYRFVELMNTTSKHEELLKAADDLFMDEYFNKMGKKEDMEEKMLNTFKIPCKAVRCIRCKYTWFSASDLCKLEGHPIKVVDTMKRFFKCNDCGNRTVSLEVIPLINCKQCGKANWKRAPVLSEKKTLANLNQLSVRGDEMKFINSFDNKGSLNLLVPD